MLRHWFEILRQQAASMGRCFISRYDDEIRRGRWLNEKSRVESRDLLERLPNNGGCRDVQLPQTPIPLSKFQISETGS